LSCANGSTTIVFKTFEFLHPNDVSKIEIILSTSFCRVELARDCPGKPPFDFDGLEVAVEVTTGVDVDDGVSVGVIVGVDVDVGVSVGVDVSVAVGVNVGAAV
jgi:hypothetical protein